MDDQKQRDIAGKGGRAAHEKGTAHELSSEEASEAAARVGSILTADKVMAVPRNMTARQISRVIQAPAEAHLSSTPRRAARVTRIANRKAML